MPSFIMCRSTARRQGQTYGEFVGEDRYTTKESERLLRLPMFYALKPELCDYIIVCIRGYWTGSKAE